LPETLAEDYSFGQSPFAYQVLTVIPGRDINDVIPTLDDKQLKAIAAILRFSRRRKANPVTWNFDSAET
jgi:hypothetical protein